MVIQRVLISNRSWLPRRHRKRCGDPFCLCLLHSLLLTSIILCTIFWIKHETSNKFTLDEILSSGFTAEDVRLINYIRLTEMWPPSHQPYNLTNKHNDTNINIYSQHFIEYMLEALFDEKKNGVFVEAGAFDGEVSSNTLHLEKNYGWRGLLIEPGIDYHAALKSKHRKSHIYPGCISLNKYSMKIDFLEESFSSHVFSGSSLFDDDYTTWSSRWLCKNEVVILLPYHVGTHSLRAAGCRQLGRHSVMCYPLYTLLLAANIDNIDFLSLDTAGSDYSIIQTIPFDKVYIKSLLVAVENIEDRERMDSYMIDAGYHRVVLIAEYNVTDETHDRDVLYVHNNITIPIL